MSAHRVIFLRPSETMDYEEGRVGAGGTLYPGMNAKLQSDGTYLPGAGPAIRLVREDTLQGGTVDTPKLEDDVVFMGSPVPGNRVNVMVAADQVVAIGDRLLAGADGMFTVNVAGELKAVEAIDLTGEEDSLVAAEMI